MQQQIEQIEIIERTLHESRRPITTRAEANAFQPQSSVCHSTEHFLSAGDGAGMDQDRRFQLTSERDAGHDLSLLYSPSGAALMPPPLLQSTPERVNQFGYDLHEVHTNEGGARVVETHGAGHLMLDRSLAETSGGGPAAHRSPPPMDEPRSILKSSLSSAVGQQAVAEAGESAAWRKSPSTESSSVQRKDSYRRMQDQEAERQSSNATILSRQSKGTAGPNWASRFASKAAGGEKGSLVRMKDSLAELSRQMREGQWTPRLVFALALSGLLLLLLLLLLWFALSSLFLSQSTFVFWLYPPLCEECQRRAGFSSGQRTPSKLYVHLASPAQAHFELVGNAPFKSNSFTAVDFDTGYIAIADHALTDDHGRHTSCFLMQLDRSALPDMSVLRDALGNTFEEVHSQFGWQEYWQFNVEPVDASFANSKFRDRIEDCQQNAQWYQLKHALYTKDSSCYSCYDFCLPDFAVLRRQKYEDEPSLGVRRLNCFRLYVPEWAKYQIETDPSGGHSHYPVHQPQNTQRDSHGNWVNWAQQQTPLTFSRQRRRSSSNNSRAGN